MICQAKTGFLVRSGGPKKTVGSLYGWMYQCHVAVMLNKSELV